MIDALSAAAAMPAEPGNVMAVTGVDTATPPVNSPAPMMIAYFVCIPSLPISVITKMVPNGRTD